jgi:uncharacterized protein (TIGR00730 family)
MPKDASLGRPLLHPDTMTEQEQVAWQQKQLEDLWRIFAISGEFARGFETLSRLGPCITVFGSARSPEGSPEYELARRAARECVRRGYGVITGGGPGIMEAANRGAREGGGVSVGLNIVLPHEQGANAFVDRDKLIDFEFFFVRKTMLVKYAQGYIVMPGGFGTLDELSEALTLIQTGKSTRFPIVLVGREFWGHFTDWIRDTLLSGGYISEGDLDLFTVTDDPEEAVALIDAFYNEHAIAPNF